MAMPVTQTPPSTPLASTQAVAKRLGFCADTIRSLAARGVIPSPIKIGKRFRWDLAAIEAALSSKQGAK